MVASKKKASDYLQLMRGRFPFRMVQAALKDSELESAQGWDPLLRKYEAATAYDNDHETIEQISCISRNFTLYAEKAIAFYSVESQVAKRLKKLLEQQFSPNRFSETYPFLLSESALNKERSILFPTALEASQEGNQLVLARKIYETVRETVNASEITGAVPMELEGFDQYIAIRRTVRQLFHNVTIRTGAKDQDFIEIRLDGIDSLTGSDLGKNFETVVSWLNDLFDSKYGEKPVGKAVDLYPAIARLYSASDGAINQFGSSTTTASLKSERMRNRKDDLRKEPFHAAGRKATTIEGYRLEKTWPGVRGSFPLTILIPGHITHPNAQAASIPFAYITGASNEDDFSFVIHKLFLALKM